MKPVIEAKVHLNAIDFNNLPPEFRKASANMTMAAMACQQALEQHPTVDRNTVPVILATRFGEVSESFQFLKTLKETQTPRPILFQNSLHNSTLGFLSMQLKLKGPVITVSHDEAQQTCVDELIQTFLVNHRAVVVCTVDSVPEAWRETFQKHSPDLKLDQAVCQIFEGAGV